MRSERSPGSVLGRCLFETHRSETPRPLPSSFGFHLTGCLSDSEDVQREANKLLADYKFKLQKAEQDMSTLQATVARLESQVIRYKSAAEASEKAEDELKVEKRKLQREVRTPMPLAPHRFLIPASFCDDSLLQVRETQGRVEELETANSHLQRRLDKLKNAKSALLKEL